MNEREPAPPELVFAEDDDDGAIERLEAHADLAPPAAGARVVAWPSGRAVVVEAGEPERLTVRGPEGNVELSIRFGPEGPVLSFAAAAIDLSARGDLRLDCGKLEVRAREGISLESGGDLVEQAAGRHTTEAHAVQIRARRGDVEVKANDDVRVDGERVLLNS